MVIEWSISVGNLLTIFGVLAGVMYTGGIVMGRIKTIELSLKQHGEQLTVIMQELKTVIRNDERLTALEKRINEMQMIRDQWRIEVAGRLSDMSQSLANMFQQQTQLLNDRLPPFRDQRG